MKRKDAIRKKLEKRRESLTALVGKVEKSARRKLDSSFEEQAIQRENEEVLTSLDASLNEELRQIDKALKKMDDGTFGACEGCGKRISASRIDAVPHAANCIACAS